MWIFKVMFMIKKYLYALCVVILLVSCNNQEPDMSDVRVSLNAEVQDMMRYETRAISDIYTGTSVAGMKAAVWFSDKSGVYPESAPTAPTFLPYRANLTYDEGATIVYTKSSTLEDPISYDLEGDSEIYCVGFYPQEGWATTDATNKVATHVVDGTQDLMFASEKNGSLLNKLGKQEYEHLLPWVRFTVRATDPESATDWGKVTSIQLVGAKGSVNVTLGNGNVNYSERTGNIEVLDSELDLTVAIQDIGSRLCMPGDDYKLKIITEKGGERELLITMNFEAGNLYLVNLYFNAFNDINAVCSLVPWNEEEIVL